MNRMSRPTRALALTLFTALVVMTTWAEIVGHDAPIPIHLGRLFTAWLLGCLFWSAVPHDEEPTTRSTAALTAARDALDRTNASMEDVLVALEALTKHPESPEPPPGNDPKRG